MTGAANPGFNTINNQALAPTGTLTRRQQRKERFVAQYVGTYTVGAGQTSDQRIQTFITGVGSANTMLHSDIQLLLVTPNAYEQSHWRRQCDLRPKPQLQYALSDSICPRRNQPQYTNRLGLPSLIPTVSIDVNSSSGTYDEAYSVGTISIHYIPSGKHTRGVLSQGTANVTIHAQIYAPNVGFILRNANIDP